MELKIGERSAGRFFMDWAAVVALVVSVAVFGALRGGDFLSAANAVNILRAMSITTIFAIAATIAMAPDGFDMSACTLATFSSYIFASSFLWFGAPLWLSALITVVFTMAMYLINMFLILVCKIPDMLATCADFGGILNALGEKKTAGILAIEGADALEGELSNLNYFYDRGVRLITLTWNHDNEISGSIAGDTGAGLTDFGREVVCSMFKMGIIVDVSHISKRGFWDVYKLAKKYNKPFVASHSNAYSICAHPRNLDDEQIEAIVETGGCIGINFYADFLSEKGEAGVDDILKHMEHMIKLGAERNIGFGTDFDGMSRTPSGVSGVQSMGAVIARMEKRGFSQEFVENISYYNFLNCFRKIL